MPEIYFNAVHLQINSELCIFVKELHYKPPKDEAAAKVLPDKSSIT